MYPRLGIDRWVWCYVTLGGYDMMSSRLSVAMTVPVKVVQNVALLTTSEAQEVPNGALA